MQEIKRTHFKATHPEASFPSVEPLRDEDAQQLRSRIAQRLDVADQDGLTIVRNLAARAVLVQGVDARDPSFQLQGNLWALRIQPASSVYINWYRFDEIDQIALEDLARHFHDLWYPSSDDIDVFDHTCD